MIPAPAVVAAVTTATQARAPLGGHLWHAIEALGFLVTSLGGIAVAELIQARQRRAASDGTPAHRAMSAGAVSTAILDSPATVYRPAVAAGSAARHVLLPLVAIAGAAAAGVHFVVMPDHFEESWLYGTFFAVAATSQIIYSLLVLARPSRALVAAGALGNAAIVALWVVTRTAGIPLGPAAGAVEPVGGLDVLAGGFEIVTAVAAIVLLWRRRPLPRALSPRSWSRAVTALLPCAAVAIAVTAYLSPPS